MNTIESQATLLWHTERDLLHTKKKKRTASPHDSQTVDRKNTFLLFSFFVHHLDHECGKRTERTIGEKRG